MELQQQTDEITLNFVSSDETLSAPKSVFKSCKTLTELEKDIPDQLNIYTFSLTDWKRWIDWKKEILKQNKMMNIRRCDFSIIWKITEFLDDFLSFQWLSWYFFKQRGSGFLNSHKTTSHISSHFATVYKIQKF
jgi:hypothetical protein